MGRLDDRVAIVTGAGRGIGRATAMRLAADGAAVVVNDIDEEPTAETVSLIRDAGGSALGVVANTVEMEEARRLTGAAVDEFGKLDIVVNNAGVTRDRMFHGLSDDLFDVVLDANLRTSFHTTLAAMPHIREVAKSEIKETGSPAYHRKIVFTSSVAAIMGNPGQFNYTAAKGALIAVTKTLARELGPFGINVNAVAPGFIETRMTAAKGPGDAQGIPEEMRNIARAMISLGRLGVPDDIAKVTAFLCSADSDFVSGVTIPVTGGQIGGM
ncbi:MAG: SDR family NAD(P)-dependent oxidoreductase [Candidatus Nanopelagicales bacterium]|nr:SDR family NAD(P)-dependent oxidoreductase [Candidatus Nanopelagicales bacterium]MDZ4248702.1 SDR family NAD(P)-dependent oxidoreductase [Candidatus Nanopelagicales bacterium]